MSGFSLLTVINNAPNLVHNCLRSAVAGGTGRRRDGKLTLTMIQTINPACPASTKQGQDLLS